jgi:hypothetical protein
MIFPNVNNPMSMAIAEHYQARDLAIKRLVDLHNDNFDITDQQLLKSVFARYGLLQDGFESEIEYVLREVERRVS